MIKVYDIGTDVEFGDIQQKTFLGKIRAIQIRKSSVLYEIAYWVMDDFKSMWLAEDNFMVRANSKKNQIGFKVTDNERKN